MTPDAGVASAAATPGRRLVPVLSSRMLPPILITCILVAAHLTFGILEAYEQTAVAIVTG